MTNTAKLAHSDDIDVIGCSLMPDQAEALRKALQPSVAHNARSSDTELQAIMKRCFPPVTLDPSLDIYAAKPTLFILHGVPEISRDRFLASSRQPKHKTSNPPGFGALIAKGMQLHINSKPSSRGTVLTRGNMGISVARGTSFLAYDVPEPRVVLIIDGEMTLAELKERLELLGAAEDEKILLLASEILFKESRQININNTEDQNLIVKTLEKLEQAGRRPDLIILDNLSSLGGGIEENDNSALESQLMWLVRLRHMGYPCR